MLDIVTNLISERKSPTLDELQMEALLHHLFTATPRDTRIQVDHPLVFQQSLVRSFSSFRKT